MTSTDNNVNELETNSKPQVIEKSSVKELKTLSPLKMPTKQFVISSPESAELYSCMLKSSTLTNQIRDALLNPRRYNTDQVKAAHTLLQEALEGYRTALKKVSSSIEEAKSKAPKSRSRKN